MTDNAHIIDVTSENFSQAVLESSHRVPVLVDFWAPWCGPCQTLMPMLTRLAEAYRGQFVLAKVNIDEQQELAMRHGVRSVPTVKLFRGGQPVDEFLGALPEGQIRAFLDRHIEKESDRQLARARASAEQGNVDDAIARIREVLETEPDNLKAQLTLAELLLIEGDLATAADVVDNLPANLRLEPEVKQLAARLDFGQAAQGAPGVDELREQVAADPKDSDSRYRLAARHVMAGEYERALEQLLELMKRDRSYGDDAGRNGLVKVFEILGNQGELVTRYRRLMAAALY